MASRMWATLLVTSVFGATGMATDVYKVSSAMNISVGIADPDYWIHIYAPQSSKSFPTIFFVSGFGANAPVFGYSDLLTRIANKGYVVVGLNRLSFPNYPLEARRFLDVLTWAQAGHLKERMIQHKLEAMPDLDRTAVMGQSSGNHIVGQALADSCMYAKAFVMIDPVDGADPFGIIHTEDLITPGTKVNFSIPALILDNGLDPKGVRAFKSVACMPIALGTPRWYNAWRGPLWRVNATAYGHVDCLDDSFILLGGLVCPSDSKTDKPKYREHLATNSALFLSALFEKRPGNLQLLENTSHFNVDVLLEHDRKGLPDEKLVPGCTNVPSRTSVTLVV